MEEWEIEGNELRFTSYPYQVTVTVNECNEDAFDWIIFIQSDDSVEDMGTAFSVEELNSAVEHYTHGIELDEDDLSQIS